MNAITDRLGIGDEIRELKLGRTFTSRDNNNSFHTIRYDFKPASVDSMKSAVLDIEGNNKVSVTTPNVEGSGTAETVFKGSRKPHQKECVLIIDHETGEITLEKLSQNIIVKRTRQQNSGKAHKQLSQRPNTPIETKKYVQSAQQPQQPQHKPNSPLTTTTKSQNSPNNKQKLSPNKAINGQQYSQTHRNSPSQPISPSMPTLSALSANLQQSVSASTSSSTPATKHDINEALGLSDSSSDSSDHESSSSSSDSSSESSSDEELTHKLINHSTNNTGITTNNNRPKTSNNNNNIIKNNIKSKAKEKSSSFSSDSESDTETFSRKPNGLTAIHNGTNGTTNALPSMPKFSQLSEDLRLSESGSDSED